MVESSYKRFSYYLLLLPALILYLSIILFPIGMSSVLSLTKWKNFQMVGFIGLGNYVKLFADPGFLRALWNNVQIMLISVLGQIPLGIILAYVLYRKFVKGFKFYEMMIFMPITISSVVVALLWNRIFSPVGIYTYFVKWLTGNPDYVMRISESPYFAMVPLLFVLLWMHTSLYMVMFLANMQRIPKSSLEAAKMDGASESVILWRIVLPALANVIFTSSIFAISGSLKSFDLVFAMTGGGPVDYTNVMSIYLYKHTFTYNNYGYGSAVSLVIVILSVGLISLGRALYGQFQKKFD
ncbi:MULTISPECIES: carbohydrate ABC transporter permease [unclassified Oceanispirochaeta]|uniref:carbohydrate ABC transporter permease n=1 Tax=unclassified Oceanispirochaeta TaxID=2635722 RepID=UPI000E092964|nr:MULTISPECIES: sugar ABC transporter permease [unclassified Oceanispirochaeta]MBF9017877.1 sugar ABC transporter permease [Oceanispirochaeta sp. M2]NPD74388.1 sugar ABC transporter permease [Oceanispirochaeta sp. M1]RDG29773.1 sugar ABC transporter permease [Oceanispirochaeta sp. M1]